MPSFATKPRVTMTGHRARRLAAVLGGLTLLWVTAGLAARAGADDLLAQARSIFKPLP